MKADLRPETTQPSSNQAKMNSKSFLLLFLLGAIAIADAHIVNQQQATHHQQTIVPTNGNAQHQRRWFGLAAIPAIVCPTILPDFALFETTKDLCQQDFSKLS